MSLYEDAMNELIFDYDEDEDRVTISAIKNRETLGKIVLEMVFDAYREFEDAIEDPEIDFNDDDFNKMIELLSQTKKDLEQMNTINIDFPL